MSRPRQLPPLLIVAGSVFVDMLGYGMIVPLLPFFAQAWGGGGLLVGLLSALYALMQLLVAPLLGAISDRVGRRPVLLLCLFGSALAYLLLGLAGSLAMLALAVALGGAAGTSMPAAQAYVADTTPPAGRARGLGMLGAAFGLGLIGGSIMGALLSRYGLGVPALAAAGLALLNALYAAAALPESLPAARRQRQPLRLASLAGQIGEALALASIRPLLATVALLNIAFAGLQSNFALFSLTRFGWGADQNAALFAFVGLCAALTQGLLLGRLQPRLGEARLAIGGLALMALALAVVGAAGAGWQLYPLVGLLALGMGLAVPTLTTIVSLRARGGQQGAALGGMHALISLALVIGPVLAGLLFDRLGPGAPYLSGALLVGAALLVAALALGRDARTIAPTLYSTSEDQEAHL